MLCGTDQLASGLKAGIEGAVHVMTELYAQHSGNESMGAVVSGCQECF